MDIENQISAVLVLILSVHCKGSHHIATGRNRSWRHVALTPVVHT
jgi:hypothetical protein